MYVVNTDSIPGFHIVQAVGLVQGNTVRAKHAGRDFIAGLKNMVGGELSEYTELMIDARSEATNRMLQQAAQMGANAVINVRYTTSAITAGASEMFAYGTAVIVEPIQVAPASATVDETVQPTPAADPGFE